MKTISFRRVLTILLFCNVSVIYAQDTIFKRNDEKILAKILEVNTDEVTYKRFDYLQGPTFTSKKWELKYIVYGNGVKESFENFFSPPAQVSNAPIKKELSIQPTGKYYYFQNMKITEKDMLDIAWKLNDKKINLLVKKTEEKRFIKNCFLVSAITAGSLGFLTYVGAITLFNTNAQVAAVGGGYGAKKAARQAARIERRKTGGYMLLGALACELVSFEFAIQEKRHAHMVVNLYNKSILP